ncbi:MAG TPA: nucleoside phosphorylase [Flavobacteriaceae bacterium]|nr:nucleoside phosphorylase [Flavobacteriaceae bacterium]
MPFEPSELILNPDGSIYHLHLKPEHIAPTIITVGDPERVEMVTSFFDSVEFKTQKREFHTQTGTFRGKRITVISTGIGTDNIDIVLNELDALANIDLETRVVNPVLSPLNFIRIGTSGAIQKDIPVDSFLLSETAIGLDSLLHYYENLQFENQEIIAELKQQLPLPISPYVADCDPVLKTIFSEASELILGTTATNVGFYAPQGRNLRAKPKAGNLIEKLAAFNYGHIKITNLEMETSGIYGLSKILGHRAVSLNAILANRATGEFSKNPEKTIEKLIKFALDRIISVS